MKSAIAVAVLVLGLAVTGCNDNTSCKNDYCARVDYCGYAVSDSSCDAICEESTCVACINDRACDDLPTQCAEDCPGVTFTK